MRILGNIIWLIFGGLEAAFGYFFGALALCITIIGIPWAMQLFKIGLLCLWPFGATVTKGDFPPGCLRIPMNILWILFGGFVTWLCHVGFGLLLCIIIIGIPWGKQHFKMAGLCLTPFGRDVKLSI